MSITLERWKLLHTDIESMPLCPHCDQPVTLHDTLVVGVIESPMAHAAALIHRSCAEDEAIGADELEDEDE